MFAASSCASAGAAATLVGRERATGPARRLAVLGAGVELIATGIMERRLGMLGEPYLRVGRAAMRRRPSLRPLSGWGSRRTGRGRLRRAGAALILGGAVLQRFAIFEAGKSSARDPRYTVALQKQHVG